MSKQTLIQSTCIHTHKLQTHICLRMPHWMRFVMGKTTKIPWNGLNGCSAIALLLVRFLMMEYERTFAETLLLSYFQCSTAHNSSFDWKCEECHCWWLVVVPCTTTTTVNALWTDIEIPSHWETFDPPPISKQHTTHKLLLFCSAFSSAIFTVEIHFGPETSRRHTWKRITKKWRHDRNGERNDARFEVFLYTTITTADVRRRNKQKETEMWLNWLNLTR